MGKGERSKKAVRARKESKEKRRKGKLGTNLFKTHHSL
jgi:hypothetical protein